MTEGPISIRGLVLAGAAALLLGGAAAPAAAQDQPPPPPPIDEQAGAAEADALKRMHQVNRLMVRVTELGRERVTNERVRAYAERLHLDHSFALNRTADVAQEEGVELPATPQEAAGAEEETEPRGPTAAEDEGQQGPAPMQRLREAAGEQFDLAFLRLMEEKHQSAIDALRRALTNVHDPDVRELVIDMIPILEQHLELAQLLQGTPDDA